VGPYYLTLKSNGCIIFIASLSPDKIIVTSKHSLGQHSEGETSHAMRGEYWLRKHLEFKGKSVEDLASRLYRDNLTAVAEVSLALIV
jgi:tRNA ligase